MKTIRQIILTGIATLAIFSCVLYTGCKDKCGSVVCQNSGTCSDNVCVCPTGYFGNNCSSSATTQYLGTYDCTQSCFPAVVGALTWQSSVVVSINNPGYTVTINNFGGSGIPYDATVDTLNNIDIIPTLGTFGISARGTYTTSAVNDTERIVLYYSESTTSGTGNYNCTMTMIKRH